MIKVIEPACCVYSLPLFLVLLFYTTSFQSGINTLDLESYVQRGRDGDREDKQFTG